MKLWQKQRPAYAKNTDMIDEEIHQSPLKNIKFVVNSESLSRPATFSAPGTLNRLPLGVDKMRMTDEALFGKQVQISDKTLNKLFNIKVDDPSDVGYLVE